MIQHKFNEIDTMLNAQCTMQPTQIREENENGIFSYPME